MEKKLNELMEEAMHVLLNVDAHMESERVPVAKKMAEALGHRWPPYPDAKDDEEEDNQFHAADSEGE